VGIEDEQEIKIDDMQSTNNIIYFHPFEDGFGYVLECAQICFPLIFTLVLQCILRNYEIKL